jgi:hypothetical protein
MILLIADTLARDQRMIRWSTVIFLGTILLLVFVVAAVAIVHFSRRYRQYLLRGKSAPTVSDDVWGMHQVPADTDDPPSGDN